MNYLLTLFKLRRKDLRLSSGVCRPRFSSSDADFIPWSGRPRHLHHSPREPRKRLEWGSWWHSCLYVVILFLSTDVEAKEFRIRRARSRPLGPRSCRRVSGLLHGERGGPYDRMSVDQRLRPESVGVSC